MKNKFRNTTIYYIQHITKCELLYIGATTNILKRKRDHLRNLNDTTRPNFNIKLYKLIRDNGGWVMFKMIPLIYPECNTKDEMLKEEQIIISKYKPSMNTNKAHQTKEQRTIYIREYQNNRHKQNQRQGEENQ